MFNLLIGWLDGTVGPGRFLEYTEPRIKQDLGSDFAGIEALPALLMPESGDTENDQVARIGKVVNLKRAARGHSYKFVPTPDIEPIDSGTITNLASQLDIDNWEFQRTHWAVKDVDLFQVLLEHQLSSGRPKTAKNDASGAVQFPVSEARDSSLVAVMMPFDEAFDVVYETIVQAVEDAGLRCARADDIWDHDHVMDDVLSLIWRAKVVVADLTGKNPNVFYETGLAHALPRQSVLLTQDPSDVPFDLKSLRYIRYGLGTADRKKLRGQLKDRLTRLAMD